MPPSSDGSKCTISSLRIIGFKKQAYHMLSFESYEKPENIADCVYDHSYEFHLPFTYMIKFSGVSPGPRHVVIRSVIGIC